jgi:site-specific DNA-methyltransferase (adenine-specific)
VAGPLKTAMADKPEPPLDPESVELDAKDGATGGDVPAADQELQPPDSPIIRPDPDTWKPQGHDATPADVLAGKSPWCVRNGDCVPGMKALPVACVDLALADPPFNTGYEYDVYRDRLPLAEYLNWTASWATALKRVLKPGGTFWLAIEDEYASDLDVLMRRELGFHRRSWVVWYYTFGVNSIRKFTPSHAHLFHYVVDPDAFTFNADAVKVPSARQLVYGDKRAKAGGRLPDDTWILRPQDNRLGNLEPPFDVWYIPRVCGTYKERVDFHPCQMPLAILDRIIRVSSNPGDVVLDPFTGSGTTAVAAVTLGRRFVGWELSANYVAGIKRRMTGLAVHGTAREC